jgi:translation initiation factor 2 beta subunit (eIF-2beta)/eIF-5
LNPKTYFKETIISETNPAVSKQNWRKDMPRFVIAFITPTPSARLSHKIVESESKDSALRKFFTENVSEHYSNDEQGFYYFKEDFYDEETGAGNMIEI